VMIRTLAAIGLLACTATAGASRVAQPSAAPLLKLRGGVAPGLALEQGVLAASGLGLTASGLLTIANPGLLLNRRGSSRAAAGADESSLASQDLAAAEQEKLTKVPRKLTSLLGLALFGWGLGKLSVKRGYEKAFCQLSLAPMLGLMSLARQGGGSIFLVQAALSGLYAYIGFGKKKPSDMHFMQHLPGVSQGKGVHLI